MVEPAIPGDLRLIGPGAKVCYSGLREIYYQALLRYIGCNAQTYEMAGVFGDELSLRRDFARVDTGDVPAVVALALRYVEQAHAGASPARLERIIGETLQALPSLM